MIILWILDLDSVANFDFCLKPKRIVINSHVISGFEFDWLFAFSCFERDGISVDEVVLFLLIFSTSAPKGFQSLVRDHNIIQSGDK